MSNNKRQEELDRQKWFLGESLCIDPSGCMEYCKHCSYKKDDYCTLSHDERSSKNICAKEYNKLHRKSKK